MIGTEFPTPLVSTGWLAAHLGDPDLRILDATVWRTPPTRDGEQWETVTGHAAHASGHIRGARYADLVSDLSAQDGGLLTRPDAKRFVDAAARLGIGDGTRVVVYDRAGAIWSSRVWWLLRSFGFEDVAVLDGGFALWVAEGRPTVTGSAPSSTTAPFRVHERRGLVADRHETLRIVENGGGACLVNALRAEDFRATTTPRYQRPGRIPGSLNVPAADLLEGDGRFLPIETLRERFADVLSRQGRKVVYCGGGVAACADALVLAMLGEDDVAVYDGSLTEWVADPELPLEVG